MDSFYLILKYFLQLVISFDPHTTPCEKPAKAKVIISLPSHSVNRVIEAQWESICLGHRTDTLPGTGTQASQVHPDKHSHPTPQFQFQ